MKLLGALLVLVMVAGCPNEAKNESTTALNAGNKALQSRQIETAIAEFTKAIEKNHENHLAYYGMGLSYLAKNDPAHASDALAKCVELGPEQVMYQTYYGIALYQKAVAGARESQAQKLGKKPEEIDPDLSGINFEKPQQHFAEAVKLNPDVWRAHYWLGVIDRLTDKPKEAAEEFSKALQANPREWAPYVALGELYRHWDYTDQAIKVAQQGTVNVPGSTDVSDIWHVLGMGYDDKRMDNEAIEAFTKAIESRKDNHKSKFQRGQAYFRKGDFVHAKRDLEEFSKSGGASLDFQKQEAAKMLMDIAAKSAAADAPAAPPKQSPEDVVKGGKAGKGGGPPPKKH